MNDIQKFQDLLKNLFQFEMSDLDFGIYRILNFKREKIKNFIEKELQNKVESAFAKYKDETLLNINQRFEEAKQKVIQELGHQAFNPTGNLKEEFKNTPLGKNFISLIEQKEEAQNIDEIKNYVFNDLYNFFSRYYEQGDFIPQYRYSIKGHKYAIPYNGEEVKLYWANSGQYYIKTGLLFRDYTFNAADYKVIFRVAEATEELVSNKATKERFFILDDEKTLEIDDKTVVIRLQYRELTDDEVKFYDVEGGSNTARQEKINQKSYEEILKKIDKIEINVLLSEKKNDKNYLLHQLNRFTAKNTKDYFIHKNLKKFLTDQLNYFIKSEVLDIQTLSLEKYLDKHITRAKVVKEIGKTIIDFLSQIEDFQKKLWEKKKFVLNTEYVITIDKIKEYAGESLLKIIISEILNNKDQLNEWQGLGFGEINNEKDLILKQDLTGIEYKKLPIDTKYFSQEFKEKLLERLTEKANLDDLLDGLLIKSENWQALNSLLNKYKESIKTIYIDPPYNTGNDEFLYRDRYQHSSWLTMMENRLSLASELMREDGLIFINIGDLNPQDGESVRLQFLQNSIFSKRFGNLIWKKRGGIGSFSEKNMTENHEYITVYGKQKSFIYHNILSESKRKEYKNEDEKGLYRWMNLVGPSQQTKEKRPNLNYGILYDEIADEIIGFEYFKNNKKEQYIFGELKREYKIISIWLPGEATWLISRDVLEKYYKQGLIKVFKKKEGYSVKIKNYLYNEDGTIDGDILKSILTDNDVKIGMNIGATKELLCLFPDKKDILDRLNPKPVSLVKLFIYVTTINKEAILDFFSGSGTTAHAVMKLNKEDRGKRKFILVEMADYFDTVIIPRLKKVAYSFNWKDGKPQDNDGIGVFFKYQILEQYEDTLDNIELKENQKALELFKDEYLIKYFLDYEIRESPYLLNIEKLQNPFAYKLKVNLEEVGEPQDMVIDIPETFNYLLGLKVKKIKTSEIVTSLTNSDIKRKYLFIFGEKEGKDIAIIWREYEDSWGEDDFKKDKEFIIKELKLWAPINVYVNGQSVLTPKLGEYQAEIRYIEPEFKRLMEG